MAEINRELFAIESAAEAGCLEWLRNKTYEPTLLNVDDSEIPSKGADWKAYLDPSRWVEAKLKTELERLRDSYSAYYPISYQVLLAKRTSFIFEHYPNLRGIALQIYPELATLPSHLYQTLEQLGDGIAEVAAEPGGLDGAELALRRFNLKDFVERLGVKAPKHEEELACNRLDVTVELKDRLYTTLFDFIRKYDDIISCVAHLPRAISVAGVAGQTAITKEELAEIMSAIVARLVSDLSRYVEFEGWKGITEMPTLKELCSVLVTHSAMNLPASFTAGSLASTLKAVSTTCERVC